VIEINSLVRLVEDLNSCAPTEWLPPVEGLVPKSENVVYNVLIKDTRGYIVKVVAQINGCYENGWFDACAVMIRRLLETLIIEVFEKHSLQHKIKKNGSFFYLGDLITATLAESSWTVGRNARAALPKLKDIGDKSAHNRRFIAVRHDIDDVKLDLRTVVQELTILAGLK
jgi:hypothetical protein